MMNNTNNEMEKLLKDYDEKFDREEYYQETDRRLATDEINEIFE